MKLLMENFKKFLNEAKKETASVEEIEKVILAVLKKEGGAAGLKPIEDALSELDKENVVPYKICSFDIEASSSHGDFPNAIKDYKKVAYDVIDYIERSNCEANHYELLLEDVLKSVFGLNDHHVIDKCFMKEVSYTEEMFNIQFEKLLKYCPEVTEEEMEGMENSINSYFDKRNSSNIQDTGNDTLDDNNNDDMIINEEDEPIETKKKKTKSKKKKGIELSHLLKDTNLEPKIKTCLITGWGYMSLSS